MKPHQANLFHALTLLLLGGWGFLVSMSPTALISPVFGLVFLLSTPLVKQRNRAVIYLVFFLTAVLFLSLLAKPLPSAVAEGDIGGMLRVAGMALTSLFAIVVFVRDFREQRIHGRKSENPTES